MSTSVTREGNFLVIKVPIAENPQPSKSSGKTLVVASTHGAFHSTVIVKDRPVVVTLTAYIKP